MPGPRLRTDILDAYVIRRGALGLEFLQTRRTVPPLQGSWQPVMGHIEGHETSWEACQRELCEELGLTLEPPHCLACFALEQVHPFYLAHDDSIVLSPRFAIEVAPRWSPTRDALLASTEADEARWVQESHIDDAFLWPGQRAAVREASTLLRGHPSAAVLRLWP